MRLGQHRARGRAEVQHPEVAVAAERDEVVAAFGAGQQGVGRGVLDDLDEIDDVGQADVGGAQRGVDALGRRHAAGVEASLLVGLPGGHGRRRPTAPEHRHGVDEVEFAAKAALQPRGGDGGAVALALGVDADEDPSEHGLAPGRGRGARRGCGGSG